MATRSRIAIQNQDGSVTSIYCHWDGHVHITGRILFESYHLSKTEQLIALGNISSVERSIEDTIAYHRDRGDDFNQTLFNNVEDLFENGFTSGVEYVYCFIKDGRWLVSDGGPVIDLLVALEEGL